MATVNETLQDRQVRHATYVERLKSGTVNKLIALLNRVDDDLVNQIRGRLERLVERGFDTGPSTTDRLNRLLTAVREVNAQAYTALSDELREDLAAFVKDEAKFQTGLLRETLPAAVTEVVAVNRPDLRTLSSIVNARPFQGRLLREWMGGLEESAARRVRDQIRIGLVESETTDQIVRRIRGTRARGFKDGVLEIARRDAAAVVRTAVGHTMQGAKEATFQDNAELIKSVEWVATLDTRTCPECMALDGQQFRVNVGRRPPAHIGCRCTTAPIVKSFRELGFDVDDLPPGTRASMDGEVPETLDYAQWLRNQSAERVEDALGPTRAKLFREGNLEISRFTDIRGRELTLDQLRAREAEAFRRAEL